ncbi:hypothetical protein [Saccharothrix xinjiangensis]|uniref:Uncharacterized protein n=1 Tax=Saccharothrix xinjiangensis TaxID=204798 RepID=A0ABV9XWL0_9PSEU
MPYTEHGHWYGDGEPTGEPPGPVVHCGGPAVCVACGRAAGGTPLTNLLDSVAADHAAAVPGPRGPRVTTEEMRRACVRTADAFTAVAATMIPEGELAVTADRLYDLGESLREFGTLYGRYFLQAGHGTSSRSGPEFDDPDGPLGGPGFAPC